MKQAIIIVPDNNSFLVAGRRMMERGEITLEQHSGMLRRSRLRQ